MLEFLVNNIFVSFVRKVFQQTVGIPMGTNCAPLLSNIFLYSYEAEFIQYMLSTGKKQLASQFNLTYKRKTKRSDSVLWQKPLHQQKNPKSKVTTKTLPKTSITQRLRTDLGRSVGVTAASHPTGVVKPITCAQPSYLYLGATVTMNCP